MIIFKKFIITSLKSVFSLANDHGKNITGPFYKKFNRSSFFLKNVEISIIIRPMITLIND